MVNIFPKTIIFLSSLFLLKLFLSFYLPLLNDEAYAVAVSKEYSISFFDHPPIGFWSSQLFLEITGIKNEFFFRFPFIIFGLITTLVIYQIGKTIKNQNVGLWSATLYNVAPFYFFSGGVFVVPDGPLNLGIALVTLFILKLHKPPHNHDNNLLLFLAFSLAWCFACKYQGFLIGIGCILVLIFSSRRESLTQNPFLYISFFIALIGALPTLIWNYQNDWISFQFHQSRQNFEINFLNLGIMLIASMLYLIPQSIIIPIQTLSYKKTRIILSENEKNLLLIAFPNIILFLFIFATSERSFPHWIMPGWLLLLPIIANYLNEHITKLGKNIFFVSIISIWSILGIFILHSQTGFLTNHLAKIPKWDNTIELINWNPLKKPIDQIIRNLEDGNIKLAAFSWTEAGQLSTLMNNKYEVIVVDGEQHHFRFLRNSNETTPTILLKLSLGLNPDTKTILKRLKKHQEDAYHIKNIVLKRGYRDYATASLFLFNK